MKKSVTGWVCAAGCCLAGMAMATTVTIAPGNGVETNVTARFTDATDIVVNSGTTGGGIVHLTNPLSTYAGKTTVNSGTLVVPDGDIAKGGPASARPAPSSLARAPCARRASSARSSPTNIPPAAPRRPSSTCRTSCTSRTTSCRRAARS